MATDAERKFYEKKAEDERAYYEAQEALRQLEAARAYHEKEREQSMRYYDKKRDEELNRQLLEKVQKEDKPLSSDEIAEIRNDMAVWQDTREKALEKYRSLDAASEIKAGTLQGFDAKAAEIVEKGNVHTSVPFLRQAQQLAARQYDAFEERQQELSANIEQLKEGGDISGAQVFEARKAYEAAAYERDTAQSVLAKYEVLYGKESKHYREQEEGVRELTRQADSLYEQLSAVAERDAAIREQLETVNKIEEAKQAETTVSSAETAKQHEENGHQPSSVLMDRVRDRVIDATERRAEQEDLDSYRNLSPAHFEPSEEDYQGGPLDEADIEDMRTEDLISSIHDGSYPFDGGELDEIERAEVQSDEILRAWDEGRDPFADDNDPDGHVQIQEDEYANSLAEDHQHTIGMSAAPEMPTEIELPRSTFENADEKWVRRIETDVDQALERLESAKASGDADAIRDARATLADANATYRDYLADRQDYQANLAEFKGDAQKLMRDTSTDRAESKADFKESYLKTSDTVSRLEHQGKPWAADFRRDFDEHLTNLDGRAHEEDGSSTDHQRKSIRGIATEAEAEREENRIVAHAPPPAQTPEYHSQQERDRIVQH